VAEALVPDISRDCGGVEADGGGRGHTNRVQVAARITSEDHRPGCSILDTKTKMVKFNVNRIITAETLN
jgi:hypothetical protein